jgi:hypothetical protein
VQRDTEPGWEYLIQPDVVVPADKECQRQSKSEPKGSAKCCHFGVGEIAG